MPTVFIIGAGPRIGLTVAEAFEKKGYKVAIGSRNPDAEKAQSKGYLAVSLDLQDTSSVERAFKEVREKLSPPNVVIYNGELAQ